VWKEAKEYADEFGYDKVIELTIAPSLGILHKVHRAAHELGIAVTDFQTEMFPKITKHTKKKADKFLENMVTPYTFVHMETGNAPKNVPSDIITGILGPYSPNSVIEYGSHNLPAKHLPLGNIALEMEILSRCDRVICADSFIMHAAGTLGIPTQAVFLTTPPYWVIPLHDSPLELFIRV
jgi:ADP-heptose:LPS heptosyltransferase